jgi:hypothetical protein
MSAQRKVECPPLPVDERLTCYITQLIWAMLEVDWRKRPSAQDVLDLLGTLNCGQPSVKILRTDVKGSSRMAELKADYIQEPCFDRSHSQDCKLVQWAVYW